MATAEAAAPRRATALPWFPFLPLGVLFLAEAQPQVLQWLFMGAIALLLALGVGRLVWAAGALLVLELTISNYMLPVAGGNLSLRLAVTGAVLVLLAYHLLRGARLPKGFLFPVALAFVGASVATAYLNTDQMQAFKALRFLLSGVTAAAVVAVGVGSREDLRRLLLVGLTVGSLSAVAAISQHYSVRLGTPLMAVAPYTGTGNIYEEMGERAVGLTENPLHLTDDMLLALFVLAGIFVSVEMGMLRRWGLAIAGAAMLAALYFTYTRSWPPAAAAGAVAFLAYRGPYRREVWLGLLLLGLGIFYVSDFRGNRYTLTDDSSALARPILWQAALWMSLEHPYMGVGPERFVELAPSYDTAVDPQLLREERQLTSRSVLGVYTPHNDYLNVWVTYGLPALGLYVAMVAGAALCLLTAYRRARDGLLQGVALGLLAALLAYAVNSAFHNYFDSALTIWVLVGGAIAVARLVREEGKGGARQAEPRPVSQ